MLIVIMGENNSGKSAYAETLLSRFRGPRFYIAAMLPHGEEGAARVQKHRLQRADMDFATLELPYVVADAEIPDDALVLLEDASNLLGNGMFERGRTEEDVFADIGALGCRCAALVVVTIGGLDAQAYSGETRAYIQALCALNEMLCDAADCVIEMVGGAPVYRKGEPYALA